MLGVMVDLVALDNEEGGLIMNSDDGISGVVVGMGNE